MIQLVYFVKTGGDKLCSDLSHLLIEDDYGTMIMQKKLYLNEYTNAIDNAMRSDRRSDNSVIQMFDDNTKIQNLIINQILIFRYSLMLCNYKIQLKNQNCII